MNLRFIVLKQDQPPKALLYEFNMTCIPWISQIQITDATISFTNKFLTLTSHSNHNVWAARCTCGGANGLEVREVATPGRKVKRKRCESNGAENGLEA